MPFSCCSIFLREALGLQKFAGVALFLLLKSLFLFGVLLAVLEFKFGRRAEILHFVSLFADEREPLKELTQGQVLFDFAVFGTGASLAQDLQFGIEQRFVLFDGRFAFPDELLLRICDNAVEFEYIRRPRRACPYCVRGRSA